MGDLRARLEAALGNAYRVERELGGGGMSHVFLAEERALNRKVVIKVLPPEMAAGVNAERFRREIQLAASLQHPHIVPLLSAGASGDLLYYTMPLVEGESLRAKLAREGELPVSETIRILSDVADALAYAHAHAVVHRDIKPDNILISGKHAVVTDFGVSKAVSASSGSPLTSLGVALGTPAYMAPEQAAADPHVDHRADLYALGVLGYEMLTGRPPFTAATPQAMLAAQVTKKPEPVTAHREAIPPALNALVMRCLEKHPADRWQTAAELQQQLESMTTPSGGMVPTGEALPLSSGTRAALRRVHPLRVGGSFGLAALAVLAAVDLLMRGLGLPDWVLYAALGLLGLGLPIMLATGLIERRRILASTGRLAAPPVRGVAGWLTWRKATLGGVAGFAGLGLVTTAYMAMRLLGIGPVGTLVASGVLKAREPLILATFENRTGDSTLGPALAAAFRVDLSESPVVKLLDQQAVTDGLQRMERAAATPLDLPLARELAQRERVKAVVIGEIDPVGKGYVLGASLVSAADGHVLTAVRETAEDDRALIGAIDRLSRKLRERIGESLKTIRANEPLEHVTTGSLEALRKYSEAARAEDAGYPDQAAALYQEATTLDPGFAMAYRKIAAMLLNAGGAPDRIVAASTKAFELRDRLPELERYLATGWYYFWADYDPAKVTAAYRSALERDPDNDIALNNLSQLLSFLRRFPEAESLAVHATAVAATPAVYANTIRAQVGQGHYSDAATTAERFARALPRAPTVLLNRAFLTSAQGNYAAAERTALELREGQQASPAWRAAATAILVPMEAVQGKLARAERYAAEYMALSEQRGLPRAYLAGGFLGGLSGALAIAEIDLRFRNRPADGLQTIDTALRRHPLASMPPLDRPYSDLARYYARAGRPEQARRLLAEYERTVPEGVRRRDPVRYGAEGDILLAEGRSAEAITSYRRWYDESWCAGCGLFELATAYQQARQPDSAVAVYERAIATPGLQRVFWDAYTLAAAFQRLGELNEARGERAQALHDYQRLVDLWKDADPELQPIVRDVRARMARLASEH